MTALRRAPFIALLALCLFLPAAAPAQSQAPAQADPEPTWEEISLPGGAVYAVETFDQVPSPDLDTLGRVVHAVPGGGDIDVHVDGELFAAGLAYGEASDYLPMRNGRRSIEVLPAGGGAAVLADRVQLSVFHRHTILLRLGPDGLELTSLGDDAPRSELGLSRVRLFNLGRSGAVDLQLDGREMLFTGLALEAKSLYLELRSGAHDLGLRSAGSGAAPAVARFTLADHAAYTALATESASGELMPPILLRDALLEPEQRMLAGGVGVYGSDRGDSWAPRPSNLSQLRRMESNSAGVVYARDDQGRLWRSLVGGGSWSSQSVQGDAPARVLSISPSYLRDNLALAITTEDWRLFRHQSGRRDWVEVILESGQRYEVGAAGYSPSLARDELVLVGAANGVFRSDDSGQTWRLVAEAGPDVPAFGPGAGPAELQGLLVLPEDGVGSGRRALLAWNDAGLYRSDDIGQSWRKLPLAATQIRDLAVSNAWPADPVIALALGDPGRLGAVSRDGGQSWQWVDAPAGSTAGGSSVAMARDFGVVSRGISRQDEVTRLFLPLLVKHVRQAKRYIGSREIYLASDGEGFWRSIDAGRSWPVSLRDESSRTLRSASPTSLRFLPGSAGMEALAGSRAAGLYRSTDGGREWAQVPGLPRGQGQDIHMLLASPDFERDGTLFAATQSGLWISRDRGLGWQKTSAPAPAKMLAVSPDFASDRSLLVDGRISRDGGSSFEALPAEAGAAWTAAAFSPNYAQDRTIWLARALDPGSDLRDPLLVSADGGATWAPVVSTSLSRRTVSSILSLAVGVDPLRIFVATERGIVASLDGGQSWSSVSGTPAQSYRKLVGQAIQAPVTTAVIAAVGSRSTIWSVNRGVTWQTGPREISDGLDLDLSEDTNPAPGIDTRILLQAGPLGLSRLGTLEVVSP